MSKANKKPAEVYKSESAGQLMISKEQVPVVLPETTVSQLIDLLGKKPMAFTNINYIYVINKIGHLVGVFSINEVFKQAKNVLASKIMVQDLVSVRMHTDQERVALLALKHNLKAIPVVDKNDKFLGIVQFAEILRVLDSEAVENILRFGGIYHHGSLDDVLSISIWKSFKHRIPWLLLGLFGGLIAASIINQFEETLAQNLILAAFIPLIVYIADAVGTQMEAFIIRDLAVNQKIKFMQYLTRQVLIVALIGIITSGLLFLVSLIFYNDIYVSLTLCLALFFAVLSSVFTGLLIPYLFSRLKFDPANASGPIATILQDILSVLVYFTIAAWLL